MKNKLLLLLTCFASLSLCAQHVSRTVNTPVYAKIADTPNSTIPETPSSASIAITFLDTLYSNDFSDSSTFTQNDASGASNQWVFGTNATIGNGFFSAAFASSTAANGYAMFDYFGFNADPLFANSSITVGPINLSTAVAPLTVNFEQYYAKFRDSAQVWFSLDGTNFSLLGDNTDLPLFGVNGQGQQIGAPTGNGERKSIFASPLAGQPTVWLRFRYKSDDGGYSWLVDDLTVTTVSVPSIDLELNKVYVTNTALIDYGITPISQADSVFFGAIIKNNGLDVSSYTINFDIQFNGASVASGSEVVLGTPSFVSDTLYFNTGYLPNQIGQYTVNLTLDAIGDYTPNNNIVSKDFVIDEFVYSPNINLTGGYAESLSGSAAPYAEYSVGQFFYLKNPGTLYAANIAIPKPVGAANYPLDITIEVRESSDLTNNLINVTDYVLDNTHPSGLQYKTVLFDPPIELEAEKFYLLDMSTLNTEKKFNFYAIPGDDDEATRCYGPFGAASAVNWFRGFDFTPCLQMTFNPEIAGLAKTNAGLKISAYPNPANQNVNLVISSDNAVNSIIKLMDLQGKVIMTRNLSFSQIVTESLPVGEISSGIYILQIATEKGVHTQKITIAH
jgi:hypothetical protein